MSNIDSVKQAAVELAEANKEINADTLACVSENYYMVLGSVYKKSKAKGNNFGTRICSKDELLSVIEKDGAS